MSLTAVVTTFNEEENIDACLRSLASLASEIIIVDGASTDKTVEIARKYTDRIFVQPNHANLNINKQFGIDKASNQWVISVDADERIPEELAEEIKATLPNGSKYSGYFMPRKNFIFGQWLKHGGNYPDYQLRLFDKSVSHLRSEHIHEGVHVDGSVGYLNNAFHHISYTDINHHLFKIALYSDFESNFFNDRGLKITRFNALWYLLFKPLAKSFRRYIIKRGLLNGATGFIYEMYSFFTEVSIYAKLWELQNNQRQESK